MKSNQKLKIVWLAVVLCFVLAASLLKGDSVTVTITVDNGYGFGYGDQNGIYAGQYYGGVDNCYASQIFGSPCYVFVSPDGTVTDTGPEIYNVNASSGDYVYIVAWNDNSTAQGAVASFTDNTTGTTVTTSPAWPWQVYATGINWAPNCASSGAHGPPLAGFPYAINNQITVANANGGASGTTSVGWVGVNGGVNGSLYFGGTGNGYSDFNYLAAVPACIASGAQWMEYDPEPANPNCNPFDWDSVSENDPIPNPLRQYLIYRIGPLSQLTGTNVCTNGCISIYTPADMVVYSCTNTRVYYTPTATDSCCGEGALTATCNPPSGSFFAPGTTTVNCTATNCLGESTCSFTVTVECNPCLCNGSGGSTGTPVFTNLWSFTGGSDGAYPYDLSGLILSPSANTLYGTATSGGYYGQGTIFAVNTNGTGFTNLYNFTGGYDGGQPYDGLILSGNTLYGTATQGGNYGGGTVFSVNTDGTGFTNLYGFTGGNDGYQPYGGLILSGGTLYGTASQGGDSGAGTVFAVNTNGTGFSNVWSFTFGNDGGQPFDGVILSGHTLYGTANGGGSVGQGTVFSVNTDGTGISNLWSFTGGNDGSVPYDRLILSGHTLYGTAFGGGSFGQGTVFAVNTDGTGFSNLWSFTGGNDGAQPYDGLILSGNTLSGTASIGGNFGQGTVFAVNTDGTGFTNLYSFTGGNDGAQPYDGLILSGSTLYGTTTFGGDSGGGTVFALGLPDRGTNCLQVECPYDIVVDSCTNVQEYYMPSVTDLACSNWTVVLSPTNGSYFEPGTTTTVTCEVADCCGNSESCSFTVDVICTNCIAACSNCSPPYPDSYTVTVYPGYNFLADDLCQGTNNMLEEVLPNPPENTEVIFWDEASQSYGESDLFSHEEWADGTELLSPGEGIILYNPEGIFTLTISGCLPFCPPPCMPSSGFSLIGGYGTNSSTWTNLFSCPPPCGTEVMIWNPVSQAYSTDTYVNGVWTPQAPVLAVGQSAWVEVNPNQGFTVTCPINKTVVCGSGWSFNPPIVNSCCSNVVITPQTPVTNSGCPTEIAETWIITDSCGDSANCSQIVTVITCVPPPPNMVNWWPGDSNTLDIVGGNNGVINGSVTYAPGMVGQAFDFDGSGGWVQAAGLGPSQPAGTVDMWFNVNSWNWSSDYYGTYIWADTEEVPDSGIGGDGMNLGNHPDYTTTGELLFGIYDNNASDPTPGWNWAHSGVVPQPGVWYHVAGTWGPGGINIYINGALEGTCPYTGASPNYAHYDIIGRSSWPDTQIDGLVDEVEIFDRALTSNEIYSIYAAGPAGKCKSPELICAGDKTVGSGEAWSFDPPTANFACCTNPVITVLTNTTNVSINPCGFNYTRTWQATDCCSNTASCSQTVTVVPTGPCQVFNTGMSGTNPLAGDAIDPNFALISQPAGAFGNLPNAVVITPANVGGSYLHDGPNSQWIGPDPYDSFGTDDEPAGVYHYQLQFLLCCTNGAQLSGQVAADNSVGVYLNNTFVGSASGFASWTQISANSGFVAGLNTLDMYVTNIYSLEFPTSPSPTAFRAELTNCVTPLAFNCPSNILVAACTNVQVFYTPTASNACCGTNVTMICSPPSGSYFAPGTTTTVDCVADCNGNSNACSFTVTVLLGSDCCQSNLVCNGNFAEPVVANGTFKYVTSMPCWTTTDSDGEIEVWSGTFDGITSYPDSQSIEINARDDTDSVSQVVTGLNTNCTATFCFWYTGRQGVVGGTPNNNFTVSLTPGSGPAYFSVALDPPQYSTLPSPGWLQFCTNFVPKTPTLTIEFYGDPHSPAAAGAHIDDVSLEQIGCCTNNPCLAVTCPEAKTVECGSTWSFDLPVATSCCAGNVEITTTSTVTNGTCPKYATQSWLITDACSNSCTCSQTVTLVDTTPPVITCPTNPVVVALNSNCDLVIPSIGVSATDNCTSCCDLVYSQSPAYKTIVAGNEANVIVTVTDLCGNSSQCVVKVEGKPETGPVVTCPASITVTNCLVPCVPVTATDNCCPESELRTNQEPACGSEIGPGIDSVTVSVTDCHGNTTRKVVHLVVGATQSFLGSLTNTGVSTPSSSSSPVLLANGAKDAPYSVPAMTAPGSMPSDYHGYPVAVSAACQSIGSESGTGCYNYHGVCGSGWEYVPWGLTSAASKWIGPNFTNNSCDPAGLYSYSLEFSLAGGLDPATATIKGRWAADDYVDSVSLNGHPLSGSDGSFPAGTWSSWSPFVINPNPYFQSGMNTLTFTVYSYEYYTGLRVEFTNAYAGCATCAPPYIIYTTTGGQNVQTGGTTAMTVNAGGTPPLSYQWQQNGYNIAGATAPTLQIPSTGYASAGMYSIIVANPCGSVNTGGTGTFTGNGPIPVTVAAPLTWPNASWNVGTLTNPLASTYGSPLVLTGSGIATNYAINTGTTEDFGLPEEGGQVVNVMDFNPQAPATLELPVVAAPGSTSDTNYTVIMDIYEPDTSLGTPSTLFQSIPCCVSNLGSSGQDGIALTLDASNNLNIVGSANGTPFDYVSTEPMTADAWHRVALVVQGPSADGLGGNLTSYMDGDLATTEYPISSIGCLCYVPYNNSTINWTTGSPTVFSASTNVGSFNSELYVSSIQFHAIAMTPQMIASIGSPDAGPAPLNAAAVSSEPVLAATMANGVINISWSGSSYMLQETTDLSSGVWANSTLPFMETAGPAGAILTTATVSPNPSVPSKFYRLIFSP